MSDDLSIPHPGYRGNRAGRYGTGQSRVRQGMDPDTRRLMIFAGGVGAVLVALIGASTLMGRHAGEVPVISADPRPIREKPVNPGGMKIDAAENDILSGGSDTTNAKLAPAPETPNANALRAGGSASSAAAPGVSNSVQAPIAPPAAAKSAAAVAVTPPVAKPAVAASVPIKPVPSAAPAKSPAVAEAHSPVAGHAPMVQLAALGSEEAARAEWGLLVKKMPDLLDGKQPSFTRVERDGHPFWRVRTSGFVDVAQARSFCDRVRSKGAGCSVADF